MAVAKSTIIVAPGVGPTTATKIGWSSLASGANNTYFDMRGVAGDKAILLVASLNATAMTATSTGAQFWIGSSNSAASGGSGVYNYSARRRKRMKVSVYSSNGNADIFNLSPSTAAGLISIGILGPFETARFKDSDGQIQMCKKKNATDNADVKVAMVMIP